MSVRTPNLTMSPENCAAAGVAAPSAAASTAPIVIFRMMCLPLLSLSSELDPEPVGELADQATSERHHAQHVDHAHDDRDPGARGCQIIVECRQEHSPDQRSVECAD